MEKLDAITCGRPRKINDNGGILIDRNGTDLYIDQGHPQYDEIASGTLLGRVADAMISQPKRQQRLSVNELAELLLDVIESPASVSPRLVARLKAALGR